MSVCAHVCVCVFKYFICPLSAAARHVVISMLTSSTFLCDQFCNSCVVFGVFIENVECPHCSYRCISLHYVSYVCCVVLICLSSLEALCCNATGCGFTASSITSLKLHTQTHTIVNSKRDFDDYISFNCFACEFGASQFVFFFNVVL